MPNILDSIEQGLMPTTVDIQQFAESQAYCNLSLYPRQTVLLKLIFLEEMTGPEEDILSYWMNGGRGGNEIRISPNIRERRDFLRENGYKHFREVQLVGGRRSSKGFVTGLAMAKIMWDCLMLGDPRTHYAIKSPAIYFSCIAGSEAQAKEFQYGDFRERVETCKAFEPFLVKSLETELRVATNADLRMASAAKIRGSKVDRDIALLRGKALAANAGTLRGSATMAATIDEMAHMLPGESKASADQVYCLDPETRVLCDDLLWRPIADLHVGDALVSMDEDPPDRLGQTRKMRRATIKRISLTRSCPLKISFADGSHVICSDNHRWLVERSNGWEWVFAANPPPQPLQANGRPSGRPKMPLRVGEQIRHLVDPWTPDTSYEAGYLAGLFDGEGWVSKHGFSIAFCQNPGTVFDYGVKLLREKGFPVEVHEHSGTKVLSAEITGLDHCLRLLGEIRPVRLLAKAHQMWVDKVPRVISDSKRVVGLERLSERELIDIETTTQTFIAEGMISHNSALEPSMDQFGLDGIMFLNSSPYTKIGMFYECYEANMRPFDPTAPVSFDSILELDTDEIAVQNGNPRNMTFQYPSWALFEGYRYYSSRYKRRERGNEFGKMVTTSPDWDPLEQDEKGRDLYTLEDRGAILQARAKEGANPETYKVERRGKFAEVSDAYLNPSMVDQMYRGRPGDLIQMPGGDIVRQFMPFGTNQGQDVLNLYRYKFHIDPSSTTAGFGFAIAHIEYFPHPTTGVAEEHVIFDLIKRWDPKQFQGKVIRWAPILNEIKTYARMFHPFEITFDQHQSAEPIQNLQEMLNADNVSCRVYEKVATNELNWKRCEVFKTALYQGLVHAPYDEYANPSPMGSGTFTSKDELKFLQQMPTGGKFPKVDKQDIGPVQTKDMSDCIMENVYTLIGNLFMTSLRERLSNSAVVGGSPGGYGIGRGNYPTGGNGPPGVSEYYSSRDKKMAALGMTRSSLTRGSVGGRKHGRQRAFAPNRSRGRG